MKHERSTNYELKRIVERQKWLIQSQCSDIFATRHPVMSTVGRPPRGLYVLGIVRELIASTASLSSLPDDAKQHNSTWCRTIRWRTWVWSRGGVLRLQLKEMCIGPRYRLGRGGVATAVRIESWSRSWRVQLENKRCTVRDLTSIGCTCMAGKYCYIAGRPQGQHKQP